MQRPSDAILGRLPLTPDQRALAAQFLRYGVTGLFVTVVGIGAYSIAAYAFRIRPQIANIIGYAVSVLIGYALHSRFSFRGHGSRDNPAARTSRYVIVSVISFLLNSGFVWLFTTWLRGPFWWPIPAMVFVTPLIIFSLNRRWVFT